MPPMTTFQSLAGYEVRVVHGNLPTGGRLSLSFGNVLDTDAKLIAEHYAACLGTFAVFDLPASVWAGSPTFASLTPGSLKWRYADAPRVDFVSPGIASVSLTLLAVPA
jgi:hypothetical protein